MNEGVGRLKGGARNARRRIAVARLSFDVTWVELVAETAKRDASKRGAGPEERGAGGGTRKLPPRVRERWLGLIRAGAPGAIGRSPVLIVGQEPGFQQNRREGCAGPISAASACSMNFRNRGAGGHKLGMSDKEMWERSRAVSLHHLRGLLLRRLRRLIAMSCYAEAVADLDTSRKTSVCVFFGAASARRERDGRWSRAGCLIDRNRRTVRGSSEPRGPDSFRRQAGRSIVRASVDIVWP